MGRRLRDFDEYHAHWRSRFPLVAGGDTDGGEDALRSALAKQLLRERRLRSEYFSTEYFSEAAWDMLLDLALCRLEKRTTHISSLCVVANVSATTALRWISKLEEEGMICRRQDAKDLRRSYVYISDFAFDQMIAYLDRMS